MQRNTIILASLLGLAMVTAADGAEVYRWVDKDGKVHFADTPPPDANAQKVPIASAPTDPTLVAAQEDQLKTRGQRDAEVNQVQQEAASKAKAEADARAAACQAARDKYAAIENSRKFQIKDKDGDPKWVHAEDALKFKEQVRSDMEQACNGQ